jgi:hypothetical protein
MEKASAWHSAEIYLASAWPLPQLRFIPVSLLSAECLSGTVLGTMVGYDELGMGQMM